MLYIHLIIIAPQPPLIILVLPQAAPPLYGVDFYAPPCLDNDENGAVHVPRFEVPNAQECLCELSQQIDPLNQQVDLDYGISAYRHALQIVNQISSSQ